MEPIIFKRWRTALTCLVLLPLGSSRLSGGDLVVTVADGAPVNPAWACTADGASLLWTSQGSTQRLVTDGFVAACDPAFGLDGRFLYFSGRRTVTETFRIWRLDTASNRVSVWTPEGLPARQPFALPDGSLMFISAGDLFHRQTESGSVTRLTFTGGRIHSAAVIPDGRILYLERGAPRGRLFTMLPDGTWSTLWPGLEDLSVREFSILDRDRLLVLDRSANLWSVQIADPFAERESLAVEAGGVLRSLHRADEGGVFVVAEEGGKSAGFSTRGSYFRLAPEPTLNELPGPDSRTLLAVTSAGPAPRAAVLPSIVKPELATGYLFVIDVARTDDPNLGDLERERIAELRIFQLEESGSRTPLLAVVPAGDGSVYVEAPADTPLVLEMVDDRGVVLAKTKTPIWVRPNERRGCVGCHVSPAYAPPNIRPEALVKEPHRIVQREKVSP